jgi:lipopolysaccharide biosynthesis protein
VTGAAEVRSIAFYLPQYHPIPENDEWWGVGFTEWTNVRRGRRRFRSHHQPHVPGELGYYDLREPEIRERQADLARTHGVHGFAYYHYWFTGREILQQPLSEVVRSGQPDFPFCVAWANENWTRAWDGGTSQILLAQDYSREDDLAHIRRLQDVLTDPRYITYDGKPLLLVYRAGLLPEPRATTDLWRAEVESWGLPGLYLARMESLYGETGDPTALGFDAAVDFQPKWRLASSRPKRVWEELTTRLGRSYTATSYDAVVRAALRTPVPSYLRWPCVTPMWDNSVRRRKGAFVIKRSTPEKFGRWVAADVERLRATHGGDADRPLLFVNAWNEWGEGCHLEPDERWARAYLEAHARAVAS